MKSALLFDLIRLQGRPNAEKIRHDLIVNHFGECANLNEWPEPSRILAIWDQLHPDQRRECEEAAAEELLLRQACQRTVSTAWRNALAEVQPFGEGRPLSAYRDAPAACALFPIHSDKEGPGMGHIWFFEDANKQISRHVRSSSDRWHGNSHQLADALAQKAIASRDPEMIRRLAMEWIVTGQEDSGVVDPVDLGNKLKLARYTNRKWMIPAENRHTLPRQFPGSAGYRLAHNTESAWKHIVGYGILRQTQTGWPDIDALHSFTSGAREPVLAAILLSPGIPHQLWNTTADFSRNSASDIVNIMSACGETLPPPQEIASHDMAEIETTIGESLIQQLERGAQILFNVTQGNRLMSFAVHSLAQQYENLLLIYRDLDAEPFAFTLIHYEGGHPVTRTIAGQSTRPDIEWNILFSKPGTREPEKWTDLLERLRKPNGIAPSNQS